MESGGAEGGGAGGEVARGLKMQPIDRESPDNDDTMGVA